MMQPTRRAILTPQVAWSPLRLSPTLWLDAQKPLYQDAALTTLASADTDPVGGWPDQSGYGYHATQATAGSRPILKLAIVNGKRVLRFDGSDDSLSIGSLDMLTGISVVSVLRMATPDVNDSIILRLRSSASTEVLLWQINNAYGIPVNSMCLTQRGKVQKYFTNTKINTSPQFVVHSGIMSLGVVTDVQNYIDGGLQSLTSIGDAGGSANVTVIGVDDPPASYLSGDVAEILVFSRALLTVERQRLEQYLAAKYGITLS